jgi:hypothetical protein
MAVVVHPLRVRAVLQEQAQALIRCIGRLIAPDGAVERGIPIGVLGIGIGSMLEQETGDRRAAIARRAVERRSAVAVPRLHVHIGTMGDQHPRRLHRAPPGDVVHHGPAVGAHVAQPLRVLGEQRLHAVRQIQRAGHLQIELRSHLDEQAGHRLDLVLLPLPDHCAERCVAALVPGVEEPRLLAEQRFDPLDVPFLDAVEDLLQALGMRRAFRHVWLLIGDRIGCAPAFASSHPPVSARFSLSP